MTTILANIFLVCFFVGLILTVLSLLFGMDSHDAHFHMGGHDAGGHFGGHDMGHGGDAGAGHGHGHGHGDAGHGDAGHSVPFFSYNGIVMFLTWFGGVGYILNRNASGAVVLVLLGAISSGFAGAAVVFYFLRNFLLKGETRMRPADYYLPGTLARVCSAIPPDGTGEIVYVQGGTRKTVGARSDEGTQYKQGEEVLIVRYEKGIAYVRSVADELEDEPMTDTPT